jgi:hypothetical protein
MSKEVKDVPMLKTKAKKSVDPFCEALQKICSAITSSYGGRRTCLLRIWGSVPHTTERSLDQVCLDGTWEKKKQATHTFSVRVPLSSVEEQLGSFNGRVLVNLGNFPGIYDFQDSE